VACREGRCKKGGCLGSQVPRRQASDCPRAKNIIMGQLEQNQSNFAVSTMKSNYEVMIKSTVPISKVNTSACKSFARRTLAAMAACSRFG
jgi:hypothetical protein